MGEDTLKLIELYDKYLDYINEANNGPILLASAHGWVCPFKDIKKGIEFRSQITDLKVKVLKEIRDDYEYYHQNIDRIAPEGKGTTGDWPEFMKQFFGETPNRKGPK